MKNEMTLQEWLDFSQTSRADFAAMMDRDPTTIQRYIAGKRVPGREDMQKIHTLTEGLVTPNSFYGVGRGARGSDTALKSA